MARPVGEELHSAIAAGDFANAEKLVPAYGEAVADRLRHARSRQECEQILESFHNLLSLARVMRAHLSANLVTTCRASQYVLPATHSSTVHVDA